MSSISYQKFRTKTSLFSFRLLSSVSLAESPSVYNDIHGSELSPLEPVQFITDWINAGKFTANDTKVAHAFCLKKGIFHTNLFVANSLVDGYFKSAHVLNARQLFDQMPKQNTVSWNVMISGYNHNSLYLDSWRTFCRMYSCGIDPDQFTYGSVLSTCCSLQSLICGQQIYSLVVKNGYSANTYVQTGIIDLFAKQGSLKDALTLLYSIPNSNVVSWNAIISGAVKSNENQLALDLFCKMRCGFSLSPNSFTFSSILSACGANEELQLGRMVHGLVIKSSANDIYVETALVDFYTKCGKIDLAASVFSHMRIRNVVSWTCMITGLVQNGHSSSALVFFKEMINIMKEEINFYTVTSILNACDTEAATQLHCWILKSGFYSYPVVKASLVNVYSKIGEIDSSEMIFFEIDELNHIGIWVSIISALARDGDSVKTFSTFCRMFLEGLKPDKYCCSSVLSVVDCLYMGAQIHCYASKTGLDFDVSVGSSLFTMYSKCGRLRESFDVFLQIDAKDNVSWASMIMGFAGHGFAGRAIGLFREMLCGETEPDKMTLISVLTAISNLQCSEIGKEVHGYVLRRGFNDQNLILGALVNMYSKCGLLRLSRKLFETMSEQDYMTCCSLVSGYAQTECIEEAVFLFRKFLLDGVKRYRMDSYMLSPLLRTASLQNQISFGAQLHSYVSKIGLESNVSIGSSLIFMYSKCGSIDDCVRVFERIKEPDLVSWTAMIDSYAQHGKGVEALKTFEVMKESGVKPDEVTFVGILSACSHNGLVEEGYYYLNSMEKDYGIEPSLRHYACMVDVLGRSGRLKEAVSFIDGMKVKADGLIWGTFLSGCKMHDDVELGKLAASRLIEIEPDDAGAYVSMSNMWAGVGHWDEVVKVRHAMRGTGMKKDPGWSSV
ncbi:pentatricopeptide repeat-containing protein At1g74600, chloroplastic [Impatiens glandulifera]|uniref:pentatricopeptide repeat-containing protein At1g74600, chloroplastic n=1 Tax=Impatiens glandulifera TaxID=253017 RepID=UPI001FB11874|nr:pentatricopeptide repeat-containing protein At1g74600, chloroplastic [Impatiens glandulifera]